MEHQVVQFCPGCIDYVLHGEGSGKIEFTMPTIINEVSIPECMNNLFPEEYAKAIIYVDLEPAT